MDLVAELQTVQWAAVGALAFVKPSRGFTGTTAGQPAQDPFLRVPGGAVSCPPGPTDGTPTDNFVVIKQNADNTISADVELKKAVPDTTYFADVTLSTDSGQCFGAGGPQEGIGKTNGQGVLSAHVSVPARSGTTGAYVSVWASGQSPGTIRDSQDTRNHVFGSK
jgi:hypothetical protein